MLGPYLGKSLPKGLGLLLQVRVLRDGLRPLSPHLLHPLLPRAQQLAHAGVLAERSISVPLVRRVNPLQAI